MKNVKKLLALLLAMAMLFALCACGGDDSKDDKKDDKKEPQTSQSVNADPSAAPSTAPSTAPSQNNNNVAPALSPAGVWYLEGFTMTLNADGTGSMSDGEQTANIQWSTNGNNITLKIELDGVSDETTTQYTVSDTQLILTDEEGDEVWTKKSAANDTPVDEPDVEVTYDAALIGSWTLEGVVMDLRADGVGSMNFEGESVDLEWATIDGVLGFIVADEEYYAVYEISGNTLTLTYEDGDIETWTK